MLNRLLDEIIQAAPDNTAIVYGSDRISYLSLGEKINVLALSLRRQGVGVGDRVLVLLPNSPELVVAFFATAKIGARLMMLDPTITSSELDNYLPHFVPGVLIINQERIEIVSQVTTYNKNISVFSVDGLLQNNYGRHEEEAMQANERVAAVHEGVFLYTLSSGSTGHRKIVCHNQLSLCHIVSSSRLSLKITSNDRVLCLLPLHLSFGMQIFLLATLGSGATLIIFKLSLSGSPLITQRLRILRLIEKEKVSILPAVPFIIKTLIGMPSHLIGGISSLRLCLSTGSELKKDIFDVFTQRFGVPIRRGYGSAETALISFNTEENSDKYFSSVGRPEKGVVVQIVDDEGQEVPPGVKGRIRVKSFTIAIGYADRPDLNASVFQNGWFLTDDLGRKDADGRLYLTGRVSDWIEAGGHKISPKEIESVLISHDDIAEAVVVKTKTSSKNTVIKAVVVLKKYSVLTYDELKSYCWSNLSSHKVPLVFEFRDELPRTAMGKIEKWRLANVSTNSDVQER